MGPLPKRKVSKGRRDRRRAHDAIGAPRLVECNNCHEKTLPHRACPHCGHYKGRQVVEDQGQGIGSFPSIDEGIWHFAPSPFFLLAAGSGGDALMCALRRAGCLPLEWNIRIMTEFNFLARRPGVAYLFPGQGSQSVGMGRELAAEYAAARGRRLRRPTTCWGLR